jgi:hypothetical protein
MKYLKLYLNWLYHKVNLSEKEYVSQIKEGEVYFCCRNITPTSLEVGNRDNPFVI